MWDPKTAIFIVLFLNSASPNPGFYVGNRSLSMDVPTADLLLFLSPYLKPIIDSPQDPLPWCEQRSKTSETSSVELFHLEDCVSEDKALSTPDPKWTLISRNQELTGQVGFSKAPLFHHVVRATERPWLWWLTVNTELFSCHYLLTPKCSSPAPQRKPINRSPHFRRCCLSNGISSSHLLSETWTPLLSEPMWGYRGETTHRKCSWACSLKYYSQYFPGKRETNAPLDRPPPVGPIWTLPIWVVVAEQPRWTRRVRSLSPCGISQYRMCSTQSPSLLMENVELSVATRRQMFSSHTAKTSLGILQCEILVSQTPSSPLLQKFLSDHWLWSCVADDLTKGTL